MRRPPMVVDVGILLALEILFIGFPVAIWLVGGVLATAGGIAFRGSDHPRPEGE
jgi:hypothetical protein